jgi:hypothetical protein
MGEATSDWGNELERWLKPFLDRAWVIRPGDGSVRDIAGLFGPGERKSIQPMAERFARAITISCTMSSLMASGMQLRWRQSC